MTANAARHLIVCLDCKHAPSQHRLRTLDGKRLCTATPRAYQKNAGQRCKCAGLRTR